MLGCPLPAAEDPRVGKKEVDSCAGVRCGEKTNWSSSDFSLAAEAAEDADELE